MKKVFTAFLITTNLLLFAQTDGVGINTDNPLAKLHVNGNMRIQTVEDLDYSVIINNGFDGQDRYKALYWDPETKEIFVKRLDQPYVKLEPSYIDNENASGPATIIPLKPDDYFLFLTDVSVTNPTTVPSNNYLIGVKDVQGVTLMPVPGFELKPDYINNNYSFKAFYKHPTGGRLFYYDLQDERVLSSPTILNSPIWKGTVFAVSKKYMEPLYDITVNYSPYWECSTCGGKYGIELGKIIEEHKGATSTVTETVNAEETTEVK